MAYLDSFRPLPGQLLGAGHLPAGQAISLCARQAAVLQILSGRVWLTFGGPSGGSPEDSGDCFLDPGQSLSVSAGARMVLEPVAVAGEIGAAQFEWLERAPAVSRFARDVAKPAGECVVALTEACAALARVLRGLWAFARPRGLLQR